MSWSLASIVEAILDRNIDRSTTAAWIYPLFVVVLFGYMLGGFGAGRLAPEAALSNGLLAGIGAFVLWIPVRIVIWARARRDRASSPATPPCCARARSSGTS